MCHKTSFTALNSTINKGFNSFLAAWEVIGVYWIFKTKFNLNGFIQKNKVRFIAKGYSQQREIDFQETFVLVARFDTNRVLVVLAAQKGWFLHQPDIKTTFLI